MVTDLPVKKTADSGHDCDDGGYLDLDSDDKGDHTYSNLGILALSSLLGGMTYSLLSPFYTKEAIRKGCSVTEIGIVSVYLLIQVPRNKYLYDSQWVI